MDPITGDAVLGGVVNLLGNVFGFGSQQSANEQNMKIAQMNNEFNERMLDKQLDYNTKMWHAQNLYNSASQQRYRLEQAGLNPYMMMDGGNAGTASSASGINPPQAQQVQMQAYRPDFSGITGILQTLMDVQAMKSLRNAQANNLNAGTAGIQIENKYKVPMLERQLESMQWDNVVKASQERLNNMNFARMQAMFSSDFERAQREAENARFTGELIRAQTAYQQMQGLLTSKELSVFDERFLQEMSLMSAQQYSLVEAGKLSKAQADKAIEEALNVKVQRYGIHVDNFVKDRTKRALIKTSWENAKLIGKEADASPEVFTGGFATRYRKFVNTFLNPLGGAFWGSGIGYAAGKYRSGSDDRHNKKVMKKLLKK